MPSRPATVRRQLARRRGRHFAPRTSRRMASAQFVSNIGSWMQTVGAQELMLTLTTSATLVALIQTAASLPVVLLAVPAGAIGDSWIVADCSSPRSRSCCSRRGLLAGLAFAGLVTPWVLLALIFAVGVGQTLDLAHLADAPARARRPGGPSASDLARRGQHEPQPGRRSRHRRGDLRGEQRSGPVRRQCRELPAGDRRGCSLARWRTTGRALSRARAVVTAALRAGGRYVAASPALRVILLRAGLFMFFAQLDLGAAAAGREHAAASRLGRLRAPARWRGHRSGGRRGRAAETARARERRERLMTSGTLVFAGVTLALAYVRVDCTGSGRRADRRRRVDPRALDAELAVSVDSAGLGQGARDVLLPRGLPGRRRDW